MSTAQITDIQAMSKLMRVMEYLQEHSDDLAAQGIIHKAETGNK